MNKRVQSFLLIICMLITTGLPAFAADPVTPGFKSVNFNLNKALATTYINFGSDMRGNDGDQSTGLNHTNRNAGDLITMRFDLATQWVKNSGNGTNDTVGTTVTVPTYNKVVYNARHWNAGTFTVLHSAEASGTNTAPAFVNPSAQITRQINSYRVRTGDPDTPVNENAPLQQAFSFDATDDRYVGCMFSYRISHNANSQAGGYYNAWVNEFEVYYVTPNSVSIRADTYSVFENDTISLEGKVFDIDGDEILDSNLTGLNWTTDAQYASIEQTTGVLTILSGFSGSETFNVSIESTVPGCEMLMDTKQITINEADKTEIELKEAVANLDFSKISNQRIDFVGSNLSLLYEQNGILQIGSKSYSDMSISWSSNNTGVISDTGIVTRPSGSNVTVRLIATLSKRDGEGTLLTEEKHFDITVIRTGQPIDMVNIMSGGYGWTSSGWGIASNAVDGLISTRWTLGNHTHTPMTGALKTASGQIEKYNKIIIYFWNTTNMTSYSVTGYTFVSGDPGSPASAPFGGGTGAVNIIAYNIANPASIPDVEGKVVIKLPETLQSRYFGVTILNGTDTTDNSCGIFEFEAYYATPFDVKPTDPNAKIFAPGRVGTAINDIPSLTVYDETEDELIANFPYSISLARNYQGVTLENGKLHVEYGCAEPNIDLLYRSQDDDEVWLEKIITIPIETYTAEYYEAVEASERLAALFTDFIESDIELPLTDGGVSIVWSSSAEAFISADGIVNRPSFNAKDENVKLTAVLTRGAYSITKTFDVVVVREMTDQQRTLEDANRIDLGVYGSVSSNLILPVRGYYGSNITWASNKSNIISHSGIYNRVSSSSSREIVVLTATLTYNGSMTKKDFTLYAETISDSSRGNTNGGGGGGGMPLRNHVSDQSGEIQLKPLTEKELNRGLFFDVPHEHWAYAYIETLAEKRLINGVEPGLFEPDRSIKREEFVRMIISIFNVTLKPGKTSFTDVESGMWYDDYIATAFRDGLITGKSDTIFGIGENISREDMAVILERLLASYGIDFFEIEKTYIDAVDISDYAASAIANLSAAGIFGGDHTGAFRPKGYATRAEAAKALLLAAGMDVAVVQPSTVIIGDNYEQGTEETLDGIYDENVPSGELDQEEEAE